MNKWKDIEWEIAMNADEKPIYYWTEMDSGSRNRSIKLYKPSIAKLLSKRTGRKMTPVAN